MALGAGAFAWRWCGGSGDAPDVDVRGIRTIAAENALPGTADWAIERPALLGEIAGYCGQVSVQRGESADLYVSTAKEDGPYEADVFRMGWYGGAGARLVRQIRDVRGENQGRWTPERGTEDCRSCQVDPDTLLLESNWKRSLRIEIADDWVSGVYLVRLRETESSTAAYAIFIVRDDDSPAPTIVQCSTNTWQAYNGWGDASLYGSFGADRNYVGKTRRAYRVSYDRPYDVTLQGGRNYGAGEFLTWEYNFIRWAESQGFPMTYTTNVDVSLRGDLLQRYKLFVSIGHDEYWTREQRDAVEFARDAGVNLAFFSGNEAYWQSRLEPSTKRVPSRVLTVYKDAALDPEARGDPRAATSLFAEAPVSRPQSTLSGLTYGSNTTPAYQAWHPVNTDHWIFKDSAIVEGDRFEGIVGYEYDAMAVPDARPVGLEVVGASPVEGFIGADTSISALYEAASGATIFAAGTIAWSWGLDDWGHASEGAFADDRLRRVTRNVVDRLSS